MDFGICFLWVWSDAFLKYSKPILVSGFGEESQEKELNDSERNR
jgi:hypothetical protein